MKEMLERSPRPHISAALSELHPHMVHRMEQDTRSYLRVDADLNVDDADSLRRFFNEIYEKFLTEHPMDRERREKIAKEARSSTDEVQKFFGEALGDKLPNWRAEAARGVIAATGAGAKLTERIFRVHSSATSPGDLPRGLLPLSNDAAAYYYKICVLAGDSRKEICKRIRDYLSAECEVFVRIFSALVAEQPADVAAKTRSELASLTESMKAGALDYKGAVASLEKKDAYNGAFWTAMPDGDAKVVVEIDADMRTHLASDFFAPLLMALDKARASK